MSRAALKGLLDAILAGEVTLVAKYLNHGLNPNSAVHKKSLLNYAIDTNDALPLVSVLLRHGARPTAETMRYAIHHKKFDVVRRLAPIVKPTKALLAYARLRKHNGIITFLNNQLTSPPPVLVAQPFTISAIPKSNRAARALWTDRITSVAGHWCSMRSNGTRSQVVSAWSSSIQRIRQADLLYIATGLKGDFIGFALVYAHGNNIEVKLLCRDPSAKERRVGLKILATIEQDARAAGVEMIYLFAMPDVRDYYKKCGFRQTKEPCSDPGNSYDDPTINKTVHGWLLGKCLATSTQCQG